MSNFEIKDNKIKYLLKHLMCWIQIPLFQEIIKLYWVNALCNIPTNHKLFPPANIYFTLCLYSLQSPHFTPLQNLLTSLLFSHSSKHLEIMERKITNASFSIFTVLIALLSQHLVIPVISSTLEDQKNYYIPDPHLRNPPTSFSDSLCNSLTSFIM